MKSSRIVDSVKAGAGLSCVWLGFCLLRERKVRIFLSVAWGMLRGNEVFSQFSPFFNGVLCGFVFVRLFVCLFG